MSNPFFDAMGGGNLPGPMGNMMGGANDREKEILRRAMEQLEKA